MHLFFSGSMYKPVKTISKLSLTSNFSDPYIKIHKPIYHGKICHETHYIYKFSVFLKISLLIPFFSRSLPPHPPVTICLWGGSQDRNLAIQIFWLNCVMCIFDFCNSLICKWSDQWWKKKSDWPDFRPLLKS